MTDDRKLPEIDGTHYKPEDGPITSPPEPVTVVVPFTLSEPVRALIAGVLLASATAAVQAFAAGATVRGALTVAAAGALAVLGEYVRKLVTPIADPKLDDDTPLIVAGFKD